MRKSSHSESTPKVKLRLIELEVEGANAAEGLRTIAAALTQRKVATRVLSGAASGGEKVEDDSIENETDPDSAPPDDVAREYMANSLAGACGAAQAQCATRGDAPLLRRS